ncbi:MAG: hypothetical protein KGL39_02400 [Patescibacteria group bacterium]|nr:hypothetical protein [Patescibacteria group bacterium]
MAAQPAFADSTSTATSTPALSPIEDSLNQLISAKEDATLSPADRTYAEVTARENILEGVLSLSLNEVSSTQSKINSLPNFAKGSKELALQNKYFGQLAAFSAFYKKESKILNGIENNSNPYSEATNSSLKSMAQEVEKYRENYYDQPMSDMMNFYLVYYSQSVISAASSQLARISQNINQLEAANLVSQGQFDQQLKEVNSLLGSAADLTAAAKDMILDPQAASALSSAASGTSAGPQASSTPSALLTQSLSDVKQAFNIFLYIGNQLKSELGN